MAKDISLLLSSSSPTTIAPAEVHIGHVQLRDLIICPKEQGVVNYVHQRAIVEQHLNVPNSRARTVADLKFTPNTLTSLQVGSDDVLIAAGGQEADIYVSYQSPSSSSTSRRNVFKNVWSINDKLPGSINNSVLLTSLSLTNSNESSVEPRVGVSNNDCTIRLYDVPIRADNLRRARRNGKMLKDAGSLKLDVPINHSSISPDGRTLLCVGDSNDVYFHSITGGARITFSHITTLTLPPTDYSPLPQPPASLAASFSSSFSADGMKFAVASQEGVVAVWDVRSSKPMKVYHTDKSRPFLEGIGNGQASGWLSDNPWDWSRGYAPGWSVRNIKFGGLPGGKEVMIFTEHTSLVHVVDAQTFDKEDVIRMPTARSQSTVPASAAARSVPSVTPSRRIARYMRQHASAPQPTGRTPTLHHPVLSFLSPPSTSRSPSPRSSTRLIVASSPPHSQTRASSSSPNPAVPHTPSIVQALGDTFRIRPSYSPPAAIGDSTWRTLSGQGARRLSDSSQSPITPIAQASDADQDWETIRDRRDQRAPEDDRYDEDIVVIPPLGDRNMENHMATLLQMHGMIPQHSSSLHNTATGEDDDDDDDDRRDRYEDDEDDDEEHEEEDTNTNIGSTHAEFEYQLVGHSSRQIREQRRRAVRRNAMRDGMDLDDLEYDCLSSHGPSRAPSPVPSAPIPLSSYHEMRAGNTHWPLTPRESPSRSGTPRSSSARRAGNRAATNSRMEVDSNSDADFDMDEIEEEAREVEEERGHDAPKLDISYDNDIDLAGLCFDPAGERVYIASTKSVAEWTVKGGEKRWWDAGQWA